jgi:hypothetical protein
MISGLRGNILAAHPTVIVLPVNMVYSLDKYRHKQSTTKITKSRCTSTKRRKIEQLLLFLGSLGTCCRVQPYQSEGKEKRADKWSTEGHQASHDQHGSLAKEVDCISGWCVGARSNGNCQRGWQIAAAADACTVYASGRERATKGLLASTKSPATKFWRQPNFPSLRSGLDAHGEIHAAAHTPAAVRHRQQKSNAPNTANLPGVSSISIANNGSTTLW